MLVCEGQEGRKNGTGSLASYPGFINMRAVASLGKCYERRRGQSKADRRMSVTVVSGKSIVKSAHLISRQCGEEGFVPEFIQRHRGEGAPIKSLISCPHVIVIRKLQNSPAGITQWLSVVDPCTQRSPVQLSGHSRLCKRYNSITSSNLGNICMSRTTFPILVVGWMAHPQANIKAQRKEKCSPPVTGFCAEEDWPDSQQSLTRQLRSPGQVTELLQASGLQLSEEDNNGLGVGSKRQTGLKDHARFLVCAIGKVGLVSIEMSEFVGRGQAFGSSWIYWRQMPLRHPSEDVGIPF